MIRVIRIVVIILDKKTGIYGNSPLYILDKKGKMYLNIIYDISEVSRSINVYYLYLNKGGLQWRG